MEILVLIAIIIVIYKLDISKDKYVEINPNMKVGGNKNKHFIEEAFTEVYYMRREAKNDYKEV